MHFSDQVIEALKWVGIVFIAGFIGYFGRYLSMIIIERLRKRKGEKSTVAESHVNISTVKQDVPEKEALKINKKRVKATQKAEKKKENSS